MQKTQQLNLKELNEENQYSYIICANGLYDIKEEPKELLERIAAALIPGGVFVHLNDVAIPSDYFKIIRGVTHSIYRGFRNEEVEELNTSVLRDYLLILPSDEVGELYAQLKKKKKQFLQDADPRTTWMAATQSGVRTSLKAGKIISKLKMRESWLRGGNHKLYYAQLQTSCEDLFQEARTKRISATVIADRKLCHPKEHGLFIYNRGLVTRNPFSPKQVTQVDSTERAIENQVVEYVGLTYLIAKK